MLGSLKNMFNCCTSAPQLDQEQVEAEKLENQRKIDLLKQNNMSLTEEEEHFRKSVAEDNRKLIIGANTEEKINTSVGFKNGLEIDRTENFFKISLGICQLVLLLVIIFVSTNKS
jgi:hypothetical protein